MAKSEFITGIDYNTAVAACAAYKAEHGRYPSLAVADNGRVELYGGNANDRDRARAFIKSKAARKSAPAAPVELPATIRQINYLQTLIERDPSAATVYPIPGGDVNALTKAQASRLINQLVNH